MSNNTNNTNNTNRTYRPDVTIKRIIVPLSNDLKMKINNSIVQVVNKIKEKHLS